MGARAEAAAEGGEMEDCNFTSRSNAVQEAVPFNGKLGAAARPVLTGHKEGGMDDRFSEGSKLPYNHIKRKNHGTISAWSI